MTEQLAGTVALVTGASSGIGEATAVAFAEHGASVVLVARRRERLDALAARIGQAGGRALVLDTDVTVEAKARDAVTRTVDELGRLDILINNAGALWWQPILQTPPKRYDLMWEINVRAAYLCAYYALPHMVERHWGHVINCSPPISTHRSR